MRLSSPISIQEDENMDLDKYYEDKDGILAEVLGF